MEAQNSMHKQDLGMPGNFYYLRSNDELALSEQQVLIREEVKQPVLTSSDERTFVEHPGMGVANLSN